MTIKDLLARLLKEEGEGTSGESGGEGEGQGQAKNSIQALLCPKATYPTSDDAVEYVDSLGLDSSDVEDAGDFWAFIQFEPEDCTPESAKREDMEDGCSVVLCVRAGSDEEGKPSRVADTTGGDSQGDSTGEGSSDSKSKGGCKGTCSCKGGAKTKMETPTEQKPEKILPGKALIKAFKVILDELGPMQENTGVKKGCKKTASIWGKISKKEYPDEDFGFKAEDDEPDEDEGEGDEGDGKPKEGEDGEEEGKKTLSRKTLATCKDLASWLAELAGEKNLTSSQKAAAKHHASQIADLLSSKSEGGEGEETPIDFSLAEKVFAKIKEQGERLSQQVYKLTGK